MSIRTLILLFTLLIVVSVNAQDVHFSQYDVHSLYLGPQNAGISSDLRIATNYRKQWSGLSPFQTIGASLDGGFEVGRSGNRLGLGILFLKDNAGDANLSTTGLNLALSYHLIISTRSYLAFGVGGGFFQNSVNTSGYQWENQFVGNSYQADVASGEGSAFESKMVPDLSAGISFTSTGGNGIHVTRTSYGRKKILIGATASHLLAPQVPVSTSQDKLLRRYTVFAKFTLPVDDQFLLEPIVLGMMQGNAKTIVLGTNFMFVTKQNSQYTNYANARAFGLSAHYRVGDALIVGLFFDWNKLRIRGTYDFNISGLTKGTNSLGGFEIGLSYQMNFSNKRGYKIR